MESRRERIVENIRERLSDARRAIPELRSSIDGLRDTFQGIEADALELAWDVFGHDPRCDDYCPECDDVDAAYHEARDMAETLRTLRKIFGALI